MLLTLGAAGVLLSCGTDVVPVLPETLFSRAERTQYQETSLHADVMGFVTGLDRASSRASLETMGHSIDGRAIPLVILADPPVGTAAEAEQSDKLVVYVQANIHAGEVEGKEASIEVMREIALGPRHDLLENQILLFAPIYNADGNDSLGHNRRSQEGSPELTGIRYNGQGLDLNRDGMKIEAVETKAMVANVLNGWDPAVFVDLHTNNGSWHGYAVTYAPAYESAGYPLLSDYTMDSILPAVSEKVLQRSGLRTFLFGGFRGWPPTEWCTYSHLPRFLVNSIGLRNRIGILAEMFPHDSFEKRILAARLFVLSVLEYTNDNSGEIQGLIQRAEEETIREITEHAGRFQRGVQFEMAPLEEPSAIYVYEHELSATDSESGTQRPIRVSDRLAWFDGVVNYGKFEPAKRSTVPRGYVFPADLTHVAEKLREHGIEVATLEEAVAFEGERFLVSEFSQGREYQGHTMTSVSGSFETTERMFPAGSFVVDLAQPLAYLAFYLLEPESDDGLTTWNYFDEAIGRIAEFGENVEFPVFKYFQLR
jgi:hypothetical protein